MASHNLVLFGRFYFLGHAVTVGVSEEQIKERSHMQGQFSPSYVSVWRLPESLGRVDQDRRKLRTTFLAQEWPEYSWQTYMDQNRPLLAKIWFGIKGSLNVLAHLGVETVGYWVVVCTTT